jgi:hypothetical protein
MTPKDTGAIMDKLDDLDVAQIIGRMPTNVRMLIRLFHSPLNRWLFAPVLCHAKERGYINNSQLHVLHKQFDPTQNGMVDHV